jgi:hypothetical protein
VLDRTRPKAVAESRLHSSSVKVHGAPSPQWNPWQRGRREHPRAGNPRSLLVSRPQVKLSCPAVVGQFEPGGRGIPPRAMRAAGIEMRRRRSTTSTGMLLRKVQDCTRPRSKSTKAPARSHHRRLTSQSTPRFSHGSRGSPGRRRSPRSARRDRPPWPPWREPGDRGSGNGSVWIQLRRGCSDGRTERRPG